jgi:RHS repeat-associated protein
LHELGIYDYRHRYYNPELGRFLQTDPVGLQTEGEKLSAGQKALFWAGTAPEAFSTSEMNLYRYCHNDPVNKSDPMGLLEFEIMGDLYFTLKMTEHLQTIESRPLGHSYLQELRDSPFRQIIVPSESLRNFTQALDGPGSQNGQGTGSKYHLNPLKTESTKDSTGSTERPAFVGTAHEIAGHGIDNKRGQSVPSASDKKSDKIPRSEKSAFKRENEIRREHNIPGRVEFRK